ncbi:MAG: 50S ribosomal protein L1 [Bacteroidia bacterium]|nr:50S ribosomal protein L1 [Bacteroidia bacterium]
MAKISKKRKQILSKIDLSKFYSLEEAAQLAKETNTTKFDGTIDIAIRLGIDPKKSNQLVRGTAMLPHGTGKSIKVLALVPPDKEEEAKKAGADYVGFDEYIEKIKNGWTDVDLIITTPSAMGKVGALGKILGPRGLMPNPKTGTVTMEVGKAVQEAKAGKVEFKTDKAGIIHSVAGKASFDAKKIAENAHEIIQTVLKLKPAAAKGTYIKSITLSNTMGPGIKVDTKTINQN